jgi:hypothetical protein
LYSNIIFVIIKGFPYPVEYVCVCALLSFIYTGKQNIVVIINSEVFLDILTTTKMWKAYKSPITVKVWKNLVIMSIVIVEQSNCKLIFCF